jgi:hypothetical protein
MREISALLLTAEHCHLCAHAKQVLARVAERYPLSLSEIPWASEDGRRLAERDGIVFPPGIYLDGAFFGYGRLSEGKLRKWLRERPA